MTQKVCILGGTGYLGSLLARELQAHGLTPITVSRSTQSTVSLDLSHTDDLQRLLREEQFTSIVNLAGSGVDAGHRNVTQMQFLNTQLPPLLVEVIADVTPQTPLLHVASATEPTEGSKPESDYSATKGLGKHGFSSAVSEHGILGAIAVVHNVYGPHQPHGRFVSTAVHSALGNRDIRLNYPERVRDFTYEADAAHWLAQWVRNPAGSPRNFEIGSCYGVSLQTVVEQIKHLLPESTMSVLRSAEVTSDPNPVVMSNLHAGDFGFCPTPLSEGLQRTIEQKKWN